MSKAASRNERHDVETNQTALIKVKDDATGSYRSLNRLSNIAMSDEDFAALMTSEAFPEAIESTRDEPLIERRWALADALPVIFRALGCLVGEVNSADVADFDGVTITFSDLD